MYFQGFFSNAIAGRRVVFSLDECLSGGISKGITLIEHIDGTRSIFRCTQTKGGKTALSGLVLAVLAASASADGPPRTSRSRAAVSRVKNRLARECDSLGLSCGAPVFLRIFKETRELEVWVQADSTFVLFKNYDICYFSGELGPKVQQGDMQAPEGFYKVGPRQMNPASRYHLSFNLGYPNAYDRAHGRTGGALMVHGNCVSIGCFAMTDAKIEEIYALTEAALRAGQPFFHVHSFPFRMTDTRMKEAVGSKWYPFWQNLKKGYEYFERHRRPPEVAVRRKRYTVEEGQP